MDLTHYTEESDVTCCCVDTFPVRERVGISTVGTHVDCCDRQQ